LWKFLLFTHHFFNKYDVSYYSGPCNNKNELKRTNSHSLTHAQEDWTRRQTCIWCTHKDEQ
jgi:hypothetical protein